MSKFGLTSKFSRNPDVAFTQIDDDLVIMGPDDSLFYGVNPVGTAIWTALEFKMLSLSEICDHIQQQYDVTKTQCIEDITRFLEAMLEQHMIVVSEQG